jgi:hypothetical protein
LTVQKSNALKIVTRIKIKLLSTPIRLKSRYTVIARTLKRRWKITTLGLDALDSRLPPSAAGYADNLLAEL